MEVTQRRRDKRVFAEREWRPATGSRGIILGCDMQDYWLLVRDVHRPGLVAPRLVHAHKHTSKCFKQKQNPGIIDFLRFLSPEDKTCCSVQPAVWNFKKPTSSVFIIVGELHHCFCLINGFICDLFNFYPHLLFCWQVSKLFYLFLSFWIVAIRNKVFFLLRLHYFQSPWPERYAFMTAVHLSTSIVKETFLERFQQMASNLAQKSTCASDKTFLIKD